MQTWLPSTLGVILFWGICGFAPKYVVKYISPSSAIVYEAFGGFMVSIVGFYLFSSGLEINFKGIILALITGFSGVAGAFLFFKAASTGPVTIIAPLSALYPIISCVLAVIFLNEVLTLKQYIAILFALISVLLISV
ncbi:EamA family transporter [Trichothermofontia sp.]